MWIMTEHTSFGHPEKLLGQQPGFGAHVVHTTAQCQNLGFCSFRRPAHKLSILPQEVTNSQVRFLSGDLSICKVNVSELFAHTSVFFIVSGEEETHSSLRVNHLLDVTTSQPR